MTAAEIIIESFQPYINKYKRLILHGRIDFKDKDTRKFVALLMPDKSTRVALKRNRVSGGTRSRAHQKVNLLKKSCSTFDSEDIEQELKFVLLKLAGRYKKKKKTNTFAGYIYHVFKYELFRALQGMTKDPLVFGDGSNKISFNETEYLLGESEPTEINDETYARIREDDLNIDWISGHCGQEFKEFTSFERLILKLYYQDGLTDGDIANKTGYHINTIFRRRKKLVNKLKVGRYGKEKDQD